jgi:NADPH-dependent curcumin reductase CurA
VALSTLVVGSDAFLCVSRFQNALFARIFPRPPHSVIVRNRSKEAWRASAVATHREFIYVKVPDGMPDVGCFRLIETPMPKPADGQVLARTHFLSIDPYMRRQMGGGHGQYANSLKVGDVMIGRGAGVVIETRHSDFKVGDAVQGEFGWREHVVLDGKGLRKLPPDLRPLSLSLGLIGQSGATAMVGLVDIAGIKAGETVVVSAAAGAVGSAVGQIAMIMGCRAIGIAGGSEKCRHVVADLGFDDCIDYKAGAIGSALANAAPQGVDIYFDNVGGDILDAVMPHLNANARLPICGQISQYNSRERQGLRNIGVILDKCVRLQGFRIGNHLARRDQALGELMAWYRTGRLKWRETVAEGFEQAPAALVNMLSGGNIGKQVLRLRAAVE